jgi:hypothetical protein
MDSSRASTLLLLSGLPTSQEVLQPSEPRLSLYSTRTKLWSTLEAKLTLSSHFLPGGVGVFIGGLSWCFGQKWGLGGPLVRPAGWPSRMARQPSLMAAPPFPPWILFLLTWHDTCWKRNFIGAKPWPANPTLGPLGPGFLPHHLLVSYYQRLPLVLDIMKICMDFSPYDAFLSSDVPEMVDQQNLWNLLVIGTYRLYLPWECWWKIYAFYDHQHPPHTLRVLLIPEQNKRIKSWGHKQELQCRNCSRIKNTTYNSYLGCVDVTKSWTIWCSKIGTTVPLPQDQCLLSHGLPYLPLLSSFITQSLILPVTLFLLVNIFVVVHSQ